MACENEAIVQCRSVTVAKQTVFGFATNVRQMAECYPSTFVTSNWIHMQYIYVWSIRCLSEFRTVYECTIHSASPLIRMCRSHSHSDLNPALGLSWLVLFHSTLYYIIIYLSFTFTFSEKFVLRFFDLDCYCDCYIVFYNQLFLWMEMGSRPSLIDLGKNSVIKVTRAVQCSIQIVLV